MGLGTICNIEKLGMGQGTTLPSEIMTHTHTHTHAHIHTHTHTHVHTRTCSDVKTVTLELGDTMRKHRKGSDFGAGLDRNKSLMAEIEEKTVTLGRKTRTEVSRIKLFN